MTEQATPRGPSLTVNAPGKLVLWGEYAVLVGARAGVLAVDRFARCQVTTSGNDSANGSAWQITTEGFTSDPISLNADWFASEQAPKVSHPGALLWHAAQVNQWLPQNGATLHIDSSAFYQGKVKLGLGSSAAVCTALTHLCAELSASEPLPTTNLHTFPTALAAHRAAQQGAGSGIDVAASSFGGLLAYKLTDTEQSPKATTQPLDWPQGLYWQAFWTGSPASTTNHLKRFDAWRASNSTKPLTDLVAASNDCSELLDLTTLGQYVAALRRFDSASQVGIYAKGHEDLHKLASRDGVIYKPCGAGGGDLGVAFAADPAQLQKFAAKAEANNIAQIRLEMAKHGVTTQAGNHQPNP